MSTSDPSGLGNPFQGLLGDLLKLLGANQPGVNAWLEAARSLAQGVATDGNPEVNPDPIERIKLEELLHVAELHVANATGLPVGTGKRTPSFVPVGRGTWALRALEWWAPLLEQMVATQETTGTEALDLPDLLADPEGDPSGLMGLLSRFATAMGPVMLGMQFGSAAGHLAQRAMGTYCLPVPEIDDGEILVIPDNIAAFASDWSLPIDQARLWVCIHELASHAVLSRPHVAEHVKALLREAADEAISNQQGMAERLGADIADPTALANLMSDPEALLADLLSPRQQRTSAHLIAVTTAIAAYVDHVTASVAASLVGNVAPLREAWHRYRTADASTAEQAAGALFGLDLSRAQIERGAAFIRGVVERAEESTLLRLWISARNIPTPAELDAPGLWLARIDITDDEQSENPGTSPGETSPGEIPPGETPAGSD